MVDDIGARKIIKEGLEPAVTELLKRIKAIKDASDRPDMEEKARTQLGEVLREVRDLEVAIRGKGTEFGDFFTNVGDSLVSAQRVLDRQTRQYLKEDPVQPSAFRIPKLSAEFKFAMESSSDSGFNLLFVGSSESERRRQQHQINFELVAAPPPPAYLERMKGIPIAGALLRHAEDRHEVRAALVRWMNAQTRERGAGDEVQPFKDVGALVARFDEVLVLEGEKAWVMVRTTPPLDEEKWKKKEQQPAAEQMELLTFDRTTNKPAGDRIWRPSNHTNAFKAALGVFRELAQRQWEYILSIRVDRGA